MLNNQALSKSIKNPYTTGKPHSTKIKKFSLFSIVNTCVKIKTIHQGQSTIIEKASSIDSNLIPAKFNQDVTKILYLIIKFGFVDSNVEPYSV